MKHKQKCPKDLTYSSSLESSSSLDSSSSSRPRPPEAPRLNETSSSPPDFSLAVIASSSSSLSLSLSMFDDNPFFFYKRENNAIKKDESWEKINTESIKHVKSVATILWISFTCLPLLLSLFLLFLVCNLFLSDKASHTTFVASFWLSWHGKKDK